MKTYTELEAAYPHIYGPYPDNLAGHSWLRRLFACSSDAENSARHDEWEKRMKQAAVLHLPPPPPPNQLMLKGG